MGSRWDRAPPMGCWGGDGERGRRTGEEEDGGSGARAPARSSRARGSYLKSRAWETASDVRFSKRGPGVCSRRVSHGTAGGAQRKRNRKGQKPQRKPSPAVGVGAAASEDPQRRYLLHGKSRSDLFRGGSSEELCVGAFFCLSLQTGKLSAAANKQRNPNPLLWSCIAGRMLRAPLTWRRPLRSLGSSRTLGRCRGWASPSPGKEPGGPSHQRRARPALGQKGSR